MKLIPSVIDLYSSYIIILPFNLHLYTLSSFLSFSFSLFLLILLSLLYYPPSPHPSPLPFVSTIAWFSNHSRYRSPPPHLDSAGRSRSVPFFAHPICLNASSWFSFSDPALRQTLWLWWRPLNSRSLQSSKRLIHLSTPTPPSTLARLSPSIRSRFVRPPKSASRRVDESILQVCDGGVGRWRVA